MRGLHFSDSQLVLDLTLWDPLAVLALSQINRILPLSMFLAFVCMCMYTHTYKLPYCTHMCVCARVYSYECVRRFFGSVKRTEIRQEMGNLGNRQGSAREFIVCRCSLFCGFSSQHPGPSEVEWRGEKGKCFHSSMVSSKRVISQPQFQSCSPCRQRHVGPFQMKRSIRTYCTLSILPQDRLLIKTQWPVCQCYWTK